jgi:hypothetical protein
MMYTHNTIMDNKMTQVENQFTHIDNKVYETSSNVNTQVAKIESFESQVALLANMQ